MTTWHVDYTSPGFVHPATGTTQQVGDLVDEEQQ